MLGLVVWAEAPTDAAGCCRQSSTPEGLVCLRVLPYEQSGCQHCVTAGKGLPMQGLQSKPELAKQHRLRALHACRYMQVDMLVASTALQSTLTAEEGLEAPAILAQPLDTGVAMQGALQLTAASGLCKDRIAEQQL